MWKEYNKDEARAVWKPGRMYEWNFDVDGNWALEINPKQIPLAPRIRFLDEKEEKKEEKKMSKKFDIKTAKTGDKIPTGTVVYKQVRVDGKKAILTGVVTGAGIITTDGPLGKNRVRGLMPTSIVVNDFEL